MVDLDRPQHPPVKVGDFLLDQTGFPWRVLRILETSPSGLGEVILIQPLRSGGMPEETIKTLVPMKEGMPAAVRERVFRYTSSVEAYDVSLVRLRMSEEQTRQLAQDKQWSDALMRWNIEIQHDSLATGVLYILDKQNREWGPFQLDPIYPDMQRPFPVAFLNKEGKILLQVLEKVRGSHLLTDGTMRIELQDFGDALMFAEDIRENGWEEALKGRYKNGVTLVPGKPSHPTA